jgi:hypothetical protein
MSLAQPLEAENSVLRPMAISGYDHNGTRRLMMVSEREIGRAETFLRRVLRAEALPRGRYALIISTFRDMPHMMPLERVLIQAGVINCGSEANLYDGARIESTIRRFDVAIVAVVTATVMTAIRSAGHDPRKLFHGKTVWASGKAYDELSGEPGIALRRWEVLGPALAIEGPHGGGAHIDGREWKIEPEGGVTYISSRLDRAQPFHRLAIERACRVVDEPCASGAFGPRIEL